MRISLSSSLLKCSATGFAQFFAFGALPELFDLLIRAVESELVLHTLYLLPQEVIALLLVDVGVYLLLYLVL